MDPTSNLYKFAALVEAVVEREGTTFRGERRFRTPGHGARRVHSRRVERAAKAARKLNRTDKRHRGLPTPPRGRR